MSILDKASLIQIPSGYKSTKLYSLRPINGDGDFTFARSSSATRVNSEGLIEEMSANVPRLDYSGGASCASLLLEPQRTNLVTYSELFEGFTTTEVNVTTNTGISPEGVQNASSIIETTATSDKRILPSSPFAGTASTNYTLSVYVKKIAGQPTRHIYWLCQKGSDAIYAHFDMDNFLVNEQNDNGSGSVLNADIIPVGNDWYRLTLSGVISSASGDYYNQFYFEDAPGTGFYPQSYTGNGMSGFEIFAWQIEQGSYPTSYIPTSGSTVTRTADVCNNAGTSATFNDSEGVLFWDGYIPNDGNEKILQISDGTNNNVVRIFARANGNDVRFQIIVAGVNSFSQEIPMSSNNIYKTSLKYKENDIAIWVNGFELYNANSGSMPSNLNTLEFNSDGDANTFYGKTKQLMVFDEALSDEELSDLTGQVNLSFNNLATFYGYTIL